MLLWPGKNKAKGQQTSSSPQVGGCCARLAGGEHKCQRGERRWSKEEEKGDGRGEKVEKKQKRDKEEQEGSEQLG